MAFKRVITQDQTLQQLQDNIQSALLELQAKPFLNGNLLEDVVLVSGQDNLVAHGLQRMPQVWVITDIDASANVWRTDSTSSFITLQTSANCTASLWVS